ncbi:amyloid-beta A4 precursor protein-binding family A member 2-like [Salvelinus fontinalis]|uniref:amyloid-beta A4 precursor protein-binding family A member 2-like n=1 Tax=Salvelinus fontinalis TaxID=8038 RepID=UPI0024865BB1|nr:amyloid-beta A4 precursor protein-binding family A member 2-like [Salvelinus fontinalis]
MREGDREDNDRVEVEVFSIGNCNTPEDSKISVCVSESPQRAPYRGSGGGRDWTCEAPQRAHKEVKRQGKGGGRGGRSERGGVRSGREGGRVVRETDREEYTGQIVSEMKVYMSSSSSSETQDCREAAIRPRPPRPRPRPRSGPSTSTPHPHQTQSHTQQAKVRPKQAYQTHTYLTEVHTLPKQTYQTHTYLTEVDPLPIQNHQLQAQSDVRQNQQTKHLLCSSVSIRPRPRSSLNTPHPQPPQTPAQMQHIQAHQIQAQYRQAPPTQAQTHKRQALTHQTQAQTHKRQAPTHPTQAQTHKRQAPTHPTQAQTKQHHREIPVSPSHSPRPTSDSPRLNSDSPRLNSDSPRPTSDSPRPISDSPRHTSDSPRPISDSPRPTSDSPRPTSDSPRPISDSPRPIFDSPRPTSDSPRHTSDSPRPTSDSPRPISDSPRHTSDSPRLTSDSSRPTSDSPRPISDSPRPTSDSPRPTSDSPRPISDSPRPISDSPRPISDSARPASPPSHNAQTQDHTPHTQQTEQHCRETTTSWSAKPPSPLLQESHQVQTQTQNHQPRRDSATSPSPRPTSDSSSSLNKHPRAVKLSTPPASHHNTEPQRESPEERQTWTETHKQMPHNVSEQQPDRPHCPEPHALQEDSNSTPQPEPTQNNASFPSFVDVPGPCEPEDLIDGIIFAANYLGSTQLLSDKNPSKGTRMAQAQQAVSQVKSQDGDSQTVTEVDLFISTKAVKVVNADPQETLMDSALRSISYIADIGSIVVLMARTRMAGTSSQEADLSSSEGQRRYRMICYVFESEDAQLIAQSIGQAFSVAYREFLRANGINPKDLSQKQYSDIINSQEMYNDDLVHFSNSDNCKELELEKQKGESLGVVIVESGWGSILPTVILANMLNSGPAARSGKLSVGDQIMSINNTSLVGLPLATCQGIIKGLKSQVQVKLSIVSCPPVTTVLIKRPDLKFQLGFSVQNGIICSLMRGGIAERGGVRVGHRIIEINGQSVVAMPHEKIVQTLSVSVGEINMKTMPAVMFRLLTGQEIPVYI